MKTRLHRGRRVRVKLPPAPRALFQFSFTYLGFSPDESGLHPRLYAVVRSADSREFLPAAYSKKFSYHVDPAVLMRRYRERQNSVLLKRRLEMKYLLLIYHNEPAWHNIGETQQQKIYAEYR